MNKNTSPRDFYNYIYLNIREHVFYTEELNKEDKYLQISNFDPHGIMLLSEVDKYSHKGFGKQVLDKIIDHPNCMDIKVCMYVL